MKLSSVAIFFQATMQRFGEPNELVAMVILLLCATTGSFVTGAAFYFDGGFTAIRF